jgi:hypothetical protein
MLTNKLQFWLRCDHVNENVDLTFTDRDDKILHTLNFNVSETKGVTIDVPFPNTVFINIADHQKHGVDIRLESLILSGLPLPDHILDQICSFCADDDTSSSVTRSWHRNGKVTIEFFAMNWIEYHLLYGNKITSA